jgi:hypothetical protein
VFDVSNEIKEWNFPFFSLVFMNQAWNFIRIFDVQWGKSRIKNKFRGKNSISPCMYWWGYSMIFASFICYESGMKFSKSLWYIINEV